MCATCLSSNHVSICSKELESVQTKLNQKQIQNYEKNKHVSDERVPKFKLREIGFCSIAKVDTVIELYTKIGCPRSFYAWIALIVAI